MYLIIGSGKAARHFNHYLDLLKIPNLRWSRRQENSLPPLSSLLEKSDQVLLLISDSALKPFYEKNLKGFKRPIIHFSGALEIEGMISAHPLMTFGPDLYELNVYQNMYFALSGEQNFSELFSELSNPYFKIAPENKGLYHAWAVYSGNLATLLWSEALQGMDRLHVPRGALEIYLQQALKNTFQSKSLALTGPIARNDKVTIQKNLSSLPEPARHIYQGFVESYLPSYSPEINP